MEEIVAIRRGVGKKNFRFTSVVLGCPKRGEDLFSIFSVGGVWIFSGMGQYC